VSEAFSIGKLGVVINSSVNFLLYCLSGRRFRKELATLFREKLPKGVYSSYSITNKTSSTASSIV
jgi:hypothetical protein